MWSHNKIYYVYGFMLAILQDAPELLRLVPSQSVCCPVMRISHRLRLLLCLVIVCVSITCTYVLLNAEDYRWQWQSLTPSLPFEGGGA